jgi:hypothetical protein
MTRPYEKWDAVWNVFMALDQDWWDYYPTEEAALGAELAETPTQRLQQALTEWHEAFDGATDEQVSAIVGDFNPSYDPTKRFGGDRGWGNWVREHLERELASREDAK